MAARAPIEEDEAGPDRGQQIVDAAYELLAESGLEGLTIRAVLGSCDRTYWRPGDSDDMFSAGGDEA